jgi:aspartokinase/homoserine dehydrogenase 1
MIVAKFGGTSVGSAKNIKKVIDIIAGKKVSAAVVVSAVGGITNKLISAGQKALKKDESYVDDLQTIRKIHFEIIEELFPENPEKIISFADKKFSELDEVLKGVFLLNDLSEKTAAKIVSTGELLLSYLLSEAMKASGMDADLKDSRELIKTNSRFENAEVNYEETYKNIREYFSKEKHDVVVLPGFIASDNDGEITTLGRGGSDFTAAILANAVNADVLEIWTDVSGMFTANPKLVKQAKPIQKISYQEAMELSHFGAKVIYPPTIQPALDKKIPILIKNTMKPEETGTLIRENANGSDTTVKGISHIENITLLTLEGNGMVGVPGISKRLFGALSDKQINVKFITQASSEHSICLAISESETQKAKEAVDKEFEYEILQHKIKPLIVEKDLAIIALVGDKMKSHQGISGKMFSELGSNNVNIRAIAQGSTEKNISVVIAEQNIKKALNSLHAAFFENHIKQLNLFIVGVGNVGAKLIDQINQQQDYLLKQQHLNIRVIGLSSSKKMLFDEEGIDLNNWESLLAENGEKADLKDFYNHVKALNLRNSVFIDNTANKYVPEEYPKYLKDSVAVVACNKIACSSEMEKYKNLKYLSRKYHAPFLFETNVGAGLPIIDTLNNLIASGDRIEKIQAVLSGSLNFIFNNFDDQNSFYDVVKQAGTEGYTEPDPRIDLSGVDVMRKILILIRESGIEMELNDIKNESFLPEASLNTGSVEEFMENLKQNASHFKALREKAKKADSRLKYVAEFNDGKAKVGLQLIPKEHPFYDLEGKDNIVLFYTGRYADQPLIIKGAGAGADVTASGIFGDIIRTGNR